MKKLLFKSLLILPILFTGLKLNAQYSGDSFAKAKQSKTANLTYVYSEAPGFAANMGGEVQGVCVDVMSDFEFFLLDNYGITVNSKMEKKHADNFTSYLDAVKASSNGVFGLSNTTITQKRKASYNFSPPYITNIGMMLSNEALPTLNDISKIAEVFAGKKAITVKGSTNEDQILQIKKKYFPSLTIEYVNSFEEAMNTLSNSTDYFANLDFTYYLDATKSKKPIKRHPAGDQTAEEFGIVMPKNSDWDKPFQEFLTESYRDSPSYRKIIAKHLGRNALQLLDAVVQEK
ncbi:ABC-type amino acid transport substrate-binding protein [Marivirga sericea]|uniref:ABC-type amino acid transport substrate-binding protein n=1 Tax=Marivirga sericea TaxID=1028 RepID=A0A1X7J1B3_9BACT|nr:transporter substrate-binding domain-containing protein [Marivirga sericea]SMG21010.1 ABC-type amino acid transport substrate-binding protein [Marivirga sericea]